MGKRRNTISKTDKSSVSKKKKKSPLKEQPSSQELFEFPDYNLPTTKEHDESQCEVEWDSRSPITMSQMSRIKNFQSEDLCDLVKRTMPKNGPQTDVDMMIFSPPSTRLRRRNINRITEGEPRSAEKQRYCLLEKLQALLDEKGPEEGTSCLTTSGTTTPTTAADPWAKPDVSPIPLVSEEYALGFTDKQSSHQSIDSSEDLWSGDEDAELFDDSIVIRATQGVSVKSSRFSNPRRSLSPALCKDGRKTSTPQRMTSVNKQTTSTPQRPTLVSKQTTTPQDVPTTKIGSAVPFLSYTETPSPKISRCQTVAEPSNIKLETPKRKGLSLQRKGRLATKMNSPTVVADVTLCTAKPTVPPYRKPYQDNITVTCENESTSAKATLLTKDNLSSTVSALNSTMLIKDTNGISSSISSVKTTTTLSTKHQASMSKPTTNASLKTVGSTKTTAAAVPDDDNEENSISEEILALLNESDFDESVNDVVSPELGHPNHDTIPKKIVLSFLPSDGDSDDDDDDDFRDINLDAITDSVCQRNGDTLKKSLPQSKETNITKTNPSNENKTDKKNTVNNDASGMDMFDESELDDSQLLEYLDIVDSQAKNNAKVAGSTSSKQRGMFGFTSLILSQKESCTKASVKQIKSTLATTSTADTSSVCTKKSTMAVSCVNSSCHTNIVSKHSNSTVDVVSSSNETDITRSSSTSAFISQAKAISTNVNNYNCTNAFANSSYDKTSTDSKASFSNTAVTKPYYSSNTSTKPTYNTAAAIKPSYSYSTTYTKQSNNSIYMKPVKSATTDKTSAMAPKLTTSAVHTSSMLDKPTTSNTNSTTKPSALSVYGSTSAVTCHLDSSTNLNNNTTMTLSQTKRMYSQAEIERKKQIALEKRRKRMLNSA